MTLFLPQKYKWSSSFFFFKCVPFVFKDRWGWSRRYNFGIIAFNTSSYKRINHAHVPFSLKLCNQFPQLPALRVDADKTAARRSAGIDSQNLAGLAFIRLLVPFLLLDQIRHCP